MAFNRMTMILDGHVAWDKRQELFPNLMFCDGAARTLQALSGKEPYFTQICRHLFVLNSFCADWPAQGLIALKEISWSDESSSTLNNDDLRSKREFNCPDGVRRLFTRHTKPTGGNIRIHFLPFSDQGKIMIGYIGPHLQY
jgi:hypothetical protein